MGPARVGLWDRVVGALGAGPAGGVVMVTVLETSFAPRPLAPSYIRRPALQRTITRGVERGQVMIIAPGGFGKTSLAADS